MDLNNFKTVGAALCRDCVIQPRENHGISPRLTPDTFLTKPLNLNFS